MFRSSGSLPSSKSLTDDLAVSGRSDPNDLLKMVIRKTKFTCHQKAQHNREKDYSSLIEPENRSFELG